MKALWPLKSQKWLGRIFPKCIFLKALDPNQVPMGVLAIGQTKKLTSVQLGCEMIDLYSENLSLICLGGLLTWIVCGVILRTVSLIASSSNGGRITTMEMDSPWKKVEIGY